MTTASAHSVDPILLENRLLELSSSRSFFALYTSQGYDSKWGEYELLFAWGAKAVFDTDALKNGALDNGWRFVGLSLQGNDLFLASTTDRGLKKLSNTNDKFVQRTYSVSCRTAASKS